MASNLRTGKSKTIGLVVPQIGRHFFGQVIQGVESVANSLGYSVIICQSNENAEKECEVVDTLIEKRVDGIIISISKETIDDSHLLKAQQQRIPVVQFDRVMNSVNGHKVLNNNYQGAYSATTHLIEQGYKTIAYFGGPLTINIYQQRFEGYKTAMVDKGIALNQDFIFEDVLSREKGEEIATNWIKNNNLPDALFAASDFSALGAVIALQKKNIEIPHDFGIVGFANEPFTKFMSPSLSSVDQFSEEMGKTAVHLLLEELERKEGEFVAKVVNMSPELIIRDSSLRRPLVK